MPGSKKNSNVYNLNSRAGTLKNYKSQRDVKFTSLSASKIGKTIESPRFPNTMDEFWFIINKDIIINPFDLVTVNNLYNTKTIGIIKEIIAVSDDSLPSLSIPSLSLSNDGKRNNKYNSKRIKGHSTSLSNEKSQTNGWVLLANVALMANTGARLKDEESIISIALPVGIGRSVAFASAEEIMFALGIPQMENPIPAGIIETSNGLHVPISLDISYLFGPDTAHVNASGISGNQKTSYLLFLLQSCYQSLKDRKFRKDGQQEEAQGISLIIFN